MLTQNQEDLDEKPTPEAESDAITDSTESVVRLKDDDDDDDGPAAANDGDRKSRKERRAEKRNASIMEAQQKAREAEERARRAEERIAALERSVAERGAPAQPQQRQEPADEPDETEDLAVAMENIAYRIRTDEKLSQASIDKLTRQFRQMERRRAELLVKRAAGPRQEATQGGLSRAEAERMYLEAEFPEVYSSPAAQGMAEEEMRKLLAKGEPFSLATGRKAAAAALARLKRPAAPPPSAADQARHTSVPSRAGATVGSDGTYRLTPQQRNMALTYAKGRGLSDEDAMAAWVREVAIPAKLFQSV